MRNKLAALAFSLAIAAPVVAQARVQITVDLSTQTMNVQSANGSYSWPISSARTGFVTPNGSYGVQSLQTMHYSKKYHNSPMPHSIFFHGGYAIHGTYDLGNLGRPASHGCVRISPANAATLYELVRQEGATIHIVGDVSNATYARQIEREDAPAATPRSIGGRPSRRMAATEPASNPIALFFGFAPEKPPAAKPKRR